MDEIKYCKSPWHLTQCPAGNKHSGRLVVISVLITTKQGVLPGRRSSDIHVVSFLFRCLILRTHKAEILIPILEMRTARFRKSGQLTSPTELGRARPETLAQKSVRCGHWPKSASCLFYMVPKSWVLFTFLKSCKTSKEDYYFVTCENYKKCKFQCPSVKVCWNTALLIRHL